MRNAAMFNANRLKLGIFAANCSSGSAATKIPERWDASWQHNAELAELADQVGFEFMLPLARFRGHGGETDFQGATLETITWAGGLLARTKNLTVFGTVHTPLVHPIFAAKQMVTVDHISRGRFGLNIVCGWNQDEFDMFGQAQLPHDERYAQGQEWWDVIRGIWEGDAPFDYDGAYYKLAGVRGDPKPYGGKRPVVMNAGSSAAGQRFAAKNCDMMFTSLVDFDHAKGKIAQLKGYLAELGRTDNVSIFTSTHVVCRPTKKEAEEYYRYYAIENADEAAVDRLMYLQGMFAQSFPKEMIERYRVRFAGGHGSYPVVGDPDHVAAELARVAEIGLAGTTVAFMNYLEAFPYFVQEVLPRLERIGVRNAKVPACA